MRKGMKFLRAGFIPGFRRSKDDGYIILTTHNRKADAINIEELQKINAKQQEFKAAIEGEFSEKAYPADDRFDIKDRSTGNVS